MSALLVIAGVLVVVGTTSSVVRTIVVPQGFRSRLYDVVTTVIRAPFGVYARAVTSAARRERAYAWAASLSLLGALLAWLACYLLGYALLIDGASQLGLRDAFREAGSSLFTLGFASTVRTRLTAVDFAAAATGPIVIALLIGYLPTLYGAYNRRETEVTLLQGRSGEPSWGPEILARHQLVRTLDRLPDLWLGWERWAADISESHTSYPMLLHVRSPRPMRSWLVALLSVLDSAALHLSLNPSNQRGEARVCLRSGIVALRDLARVERIRYDEDPQPGDPISLTHEEFCGALDRLKEVGYPMERDAEDAWSHFRGWRVNYETIAYELAWRIDAPPALWSGPRRNGREQISPNRPENRQPPGTPTLLEQARHSATSPAPDPIVHGHSVVQDEQRGAAELDADRLSRD